MAGADQLPETEAEAIRNVARIAAETVTKKRRKKLVMQSALAGFLVATAVNIPVSKIISSNNSHNNCILITKEAKVEASAYGKQVARTIVFLKESKDTFGLPRPQFEKLIEASHRDEVRKLAVLNEVASHTCA